MEADWNTSGYLDFEDLRTRPARELLTRVYHANPQQILDLGCGPGNSTELLAQRYPSAEIAGLDSSPSMLIEARDRLPALTFYEADISQWNAEKKQDLIFANASLQWIRGHDVLFPHLMEQLNPGGFLAVQMPHNLSEPSHVLMSETAKNSNWSARLSNASEAREDLGSYADYYNYLADYSFEIDIWKTSYGHVLPGPESIVDWFRTSGLRPFLNPLNAGEQQSYLAAYLDAIKLAYPPLKDGRVILTFPRLFIVARKKS